MKAITVFSLLQGEVVKFVGHTSAPIEKRLQDMQNMAHTPSSLNYWTPVSEWLRECKEPIKYRINGAFDTKEEAKGVIKELITKNPQVLNVRNNGTPFEKVD